MKLRVCLLIGALVAPLFSHAADQERKPDAELSYPEQLAQYNKLKQPAQDFMDKIMDLRVQAYGLMLLFSKQAADMSTSDIINQWGGLDDKFKALRKERDKLFGTPPTFHFSECAALAGVADLAWDAQYNYFGDVSAGRFPTQDGFIQVVHSDTDFARMATRCQWAIDTPPEDGGDSIIVDKDTPVD
ncbi:MULTISPECIES: hypothetical protein [Serratia]|uniref:hypothetical protein n=1 Tax=Serratia TaxID=613 RepID=UPI0006616E42|nr:hypothetical protein [Serratia sp. 506_PEND]